MAENDGVVNNPPLVTIALLAYNEEKYLAETLESLLQQDFSDYEIIIGDNASEDNTGTIAQEFAENYSKIRHFRHPHNIGAQQNFNSLVKAANGKYFVLAGAHDLWSKNYLDVLVDALEKTPDAVLSYALTAWINEEGNPINKPTGFIDTSEYNTVARFNLIMWSTHHLVYGLYRLSALRKTRVHLVMFGKLAIMLGELSILGSFIVVPQATWHRRTNRKLETREERLARYSTMFFSKKRKLILPHWGIPFYYFTSVLRAKVSFGNRLLLLLSVPSSFIIYSHLLLYDLVRPFYLGFLSVKRLFTK